MILSKSLLGLAFAQFNHSISIIGPQVEIHVNIEKGYQEEKIQSSESKESHESFKGNHSLF